MHKQQGQIIIIAIVFLGIMITISSALVGYTYLQSKGERQAYLQAQALALAEAGIDRAMYQLNNIASYTGEADTALGPGTYTISVASVDANTKRVTSTAYVPNSSNPSATRTVKATASINSSIVAFRFGVQVGEGGVIMGNGARINGNLFTNGNATGNGGPSAGFVTGDLTVAGGTQATADQSWTTQNSSFNLGDVSARANLAQSFRPSITTTLNKVSLYLRKVGTPGDITLKITADNNGKPTNSALATGTLPASNITSSYSFGEASFSTSPNLTANTTYWIIAIASVNASNYFIWGVDNTDAYTLGTGKYSSNWSAGNPSWTSTGGDLNFMTYMGGNITYIDGVNVGGNAWAHSLSNCQVTGNAMYQTISSCTVGGTQSPNSADAAPATMPISDAQIDDWEAIAESGGVITGPYALTGTQYLGPKKIDGDLTVNGTLYLTGPIWVNGNVTFANNSGLIVAPSTGTSGAVIMADSPGNEATKGIINLSNNMTIAGNGSTGSYPMVLSTNTGSNAITMGNNATSVILYAPKGTVNIINNAVANQISAHTLNMSNNTTVNYVNGLQNSSFSNGPGGSWGFVPGSYVIVR